MHHNGGCMWGFSVAFRGWIITHTLMLWFRCFLSSKSNYMSNTFKHKINTKYRLGLIEKVPISMKKYWNRINFDKGEFLALRAKKREQILDNEMNNQLNKGL